jgi:hypothetical protein
MPTSNPAFGKLLEKIQKVIPNVMFIWIFITYLITAIISIYSIPLPLYMTIPISIIIQGSRFLVVFGNFLYISEVHNSEIPSKIALFATLLALGELIFTLVGNNDTFAEKAAIFSFLSSIILMGYWLEIHFVKMGEIVLTQSIIPEEVVKKNGLKHVTMRDPV